MNCSFCGTQEAIVTFERKRYCEGCYNRSMREDDKVEKEFWEFFDENMIYCGDTHSFVHRLYDIIKGYSKKENYHYAQQDAFKVIVQMHVEFMKQREKK